jgi:hypothetical protein
MASEISEIHSFHCNVNNGDAAIHLLAKPAAASGSNRKPTVLKAVLVDGGKPASAEKIRRVISLINATYNFSGSTSLKFDGVVVTTWNIDHYGGIVNLVLSDLSDNNQRCSFFKYEGAESSPKTILYSPYWTGSAVSKMKNTSKRAPCRDIKLNAAFSKIESTNVETRSVDFVKGDKAWPKICRLVAGADELIGCEILSGTLRRGSGTLNNLAAMTASSTGIFCIGADGQTFDRSGQAALVPLGGPTHKGTSSIALVAVVQGKAKHYFSGDSDPQIDQRASAWIGQNVPVMKLAGHGNITSATSDVLNSLKPSHFICSTGTSLSQHHPRWELLVLLKAFMASKTTSVIKPFFHPTNFPVYLTSAAKQLALDFEAFSAESQNDANVKALREAIFAYDPVLPSIITTAIKGLKTSAERVRWVVDWLRNTWSTLSYSTPEQHPVIGSQTKSGITVSAETQILTIRAILSATDVTIGYINGMFNLVASSDTQSDDAPTTLPSFMGKNWKEPSARTKPASEKPLELIDTAPGSLSLPTKFKLGKAKPEKVWTDLDDEAPRDQYVILLSKIGPSTGIATTTSLPTIAGTEAPELYYASDAYVDSSKVRRVVDEGFNNFVAGFEPGYLGFKTLPDADAGKLDPEKNLWAYYMSSPLISTKIELKIGANPTEGPSTRHPVTSLAFDCGLFTTKPNGEPLVFDTESIQTQFNTPALVLREEDDTGCTIKGSDVVLVALQESTSPELEGDVTVDTILRIFRMQPPAKTPPSGLDRVRRMLGTLPMKLTVNDPTGAEAYRNAIWCFPGEPYRFALRLNFSVQDDRITEPITKLMTLLKDYLGIDAGQLPHAVTDQLAKFGLEATMTATYIRNKSNDYTISVESTARFSFAIEVRGVELPFAIEIGNNGDLEVSISPKPASDSEDGIVEAVANLRGGEATDKPSGTGLGDFFSGIKLTNAWIARKEKETTFGISLTSSLSNKNNKKVPVGLTYSSAGIIGGALILGSGPNKEDRLLPEYDADRDPTALTPATNAESINFKDIFGISPPKGIPSEITQAEFLYSKAPQQLKLYAALQSSPPEEAGDGYVPALDFKSIAITAIKDGTDWAGSLEATVELNGAEGSDLTPAVMTVSFEKPDGSWLVKAHVEDFRLGLLYSHFPAGFQDATSDFLGKLVVNSLDAVYTHDSDDGGATSFNMSGAVSFGGLELRLAFQYVGHKLGQKESAAAQEKRGADAASPLKQGNVVVKTPPAPGNPAEWSFDAVMGSAGGEPTTIRRILDSIDEDLSDFLPPFVLGTEISPTDGDRPPVILSLNTISAEIDGREDNYLMLQAFINIGDLSLTFIQMSNKKNDSAIPKPGEKPKPPTNGASARPKRILRFALAKLPLVQNIPLVGQLPQPFDDLQYLWVSYPEDGKPGTGEFNAASNPLNRGFSMQELDAINKNLEEKKIPTIKYKKTGTKNNTSKKPAASATKTVVLAAGQHFIITHKGDAVVDYVFGSKKKDTSRGIVVRRAAVSEDSEATEEAPDSKPVKKGALGTTIGPLSIENIGLKVEDSKLYIILDATFKLGPITFSLLGFGVGFAIFKLKNLSKESMLSLASSIDLQLRGMELSFNQPPITLAGIFIQNESNGISSYAGGVAVGFVPYLFVAVGEYSEIDRTINNITERYKSMFVYAKLDGPLITLEFATIEGVRLGFGVNSNVRQPRIEELNDFPFINDKAANDGGVNLLAILQNMQAWITPKKESYWGAAGLKVTAFEVLEVTAVMLLQFSSKGCDIAIYGGEFEIVPDILLSDLMLRLLLILLLLLLLLLLSPTSTSISTSASASASTPACIPANNFLILDAVARMPPEAPPAATIIYLELDFAIILSFTEGMMSVQAALAPTSHILVPQCQLTGGFALCYWFSPSPYSGDWVFSAGGYHRAFQVPAHVSRPCYSCFATDNSLSILSPRGLASRSK